MGRLFGTDGIRGVAHQEPLTPATVRRIGYAVATVCGKARKTGPVRVVIVRDTRASGPMLESALADGVRDAGADALPAGVLPTPAAAFLARELDADAGIAISASHNPAPDNGIKVFSGTGFKLGEAQENEIENVVLAPTPPPASPRPGVVRPIPNAADLYVSFCRQAVPVPARTPPLRVVLDCAQGATSAVAPRVFSDPGIEVTALHASPTGENINENCGSEHPEILARTVRDRGADVGFAFDGDGDRLIPVDETGAILTGDHVLAVCAAFLKSRGALPNNRLVVTPMNNLGLRVAMEAAGIGVAEGGIGDRNVVETMLATGAGVGGEQSGHIVLLARHTTGDGLITARQLLQILAETGRPLSRLAATLRLFPQRVVNVDVARKPPLESLPAVQEAIRTATRTLGARGRVLVRYSGTQALCRVMVEGPEEEITERLAHRIAEAVQVSVGP